MGFKGYENSECPLAHCPKNCGHSHKTNGTPSVTRLSTEDPENTTRTRLPRYNSSQSTASTNTTATDDSRSVISAGLSRAQSNTTTPNTSPSPEKQKIKDKESVYRKAPWQPSLAAGGPVDLLNTFTPTPYGTFSFGGKSKKTSGAAKSISKGLAPHFEAPLKSSATAATMDPLGSSRAKGFMLLKVAPPALRDIQASTQSDGANDSSNAPAVPQACGVGGGGDEGVPAVPLVAPSTITQLVTPTQDADENDAVAPRPEAQAEADSSGTATEGVNRISLANENCKGGMDGAVNGLANGTTAGPGEPLFARRRAGTGGSNLFAERGLVDTATVSIHPDAQLRQETATTASLMNATRPAPPSSISSYSRQISETSREKIEKVRELQR